MELDYRILGLAFCFGILAWVIETLMDVLFFYEGTFLGLLFPAAPGHELYIRFAIFGIILGFGLIASRMTYQLRERSEQMQEIADAKSVISAINQLLVRERSTDELVRKGITILAEYERFECVSVELVEEELVEVACEDGLAAAEQEFPTWPTDTDIRTVREQGVVEIEDVNETAPELHPADNPPHSGLQVAIGYMDETYGVLTVHFPPEYEPTDKDTELLSEITDDIGHFLRGQHLQAERAEQDRQLQTLIDNLPGFVYRCQNEPGWPMEIVRGQAGELTGYTSEQFEDGAISYGGDVIHPEDRVMVQEEVTAGVEQHEAFEVAYRIQTASGEIKWVWEQGRPVDPMDADEFRLEGFITDITERKELQHELRENKERYESVFNSIRDAIVVVDTDRQIRTCNPGFTDLFGYELAEVTGVGTETLYANADEYAKVGEEMDQHTNSDSTTRTATFKGKSGQTFEGEVSIFTLHDADGETRGFISIIENVTERENRLWQVQVMDRILRHNLRNNVNVVQGYGTLIEEHSTSRVEEWASEIIDSTEDLLETAGKQREITQILSEEAARTDFELVRLVKKISSRVEERHPGATIERELPGSARVSATENLGVAIEELLENAIVHADMPEPVVTVGIQNQSEEVRLRIEDENPAIPEMQKSIIQDQAEIDQMYHGSGLGLWLVDLIVGRSGAVLEFSENEPRGNVVTIYLLTR